MSFAELQRVMGQAWLDIEAALREGAREGGRFSMPGVRTALQAAQRARPAWFALDDARERTDQQREAGDETITLAPFDMSESVAGIEEDDAAAAEAAFYEEQGQLAQDEADWLAYNASLEEQGFPPVSQAEWWDQRQAEAVEQYETEMNTPEVIEEGAPIAQPQAARIVARAARAAPISSDFFHAALRRGAAKAAAAAAAPEAPAAPSFRPASAVNRDPNARTPPKMQTRAIPSLNRWFNIGPQGPSLRGVGDEPTPAQVREAARVQAQHQARREAELWQRAATVAASLRRALEASRTSAREGTNQTMRDLATWTEQGVSAITRPVSRALAETLAPVASAAGGVGIGMLLAVGAGAYFLTKRKG